MSKTASLEDRMFLNSMITHRKALISSIGKKLKVKEKRLKEKKMYGCIDKERKQKLLV